RYLYLKEQTTPGLSSGVDSPAYRQHSLDFAACTAPTFVVWPSDPAALPLPEEVANHPKSQLHSEETGSAGLPIIYRLEKPANCAAIEPPADVVKAFEPF
ncbi:MAG: hypothetical protein ABR928_22265, partial [Terracidiphilus sp.]